MELYITNTPQETVVQLSEGPPLHVPNDAQAGQGILLAIDAALTQTGVTPHDIDRIEVARDVKSSSITTQICQVTADILQMIQNVEN